MKLKKVLFLILAIFTVTLLATAKANAVGVTVDGEKVNMDTNLLMKNSVIFVPLRGVFEKMGAKVTFEKNSGTIRAYRGKKKLVLTLGNSIAKIDGNQTRMLVAPFEYKGRTYVPLRFLGEALGCRVNWNPASQTVRIYTTAKKESSDDDNSTENKSGGKIKPIQSNIKGIENIKQTKIEPKKKKYDIYNKKDNDKIEVKPIKDIDL